MKIGTSNVEMTSTRKYESSRTDAFSYSSVQMDAIKAAKLMAQRNGLNTEDSLPSVGYDNKGEPIEGQTATSETSSPSALHTVMSESNSKIRYLTLRYLIQQLFCKRIAGDFSSSLESVAAEYLNANTVTVNTMTHFTSYSEEETTTFLASGKVTIEDGREIMFGIEIGMSRSFYEAYANESSWIQNPSLDPLVINLKGNVAGVSDQKFFFDLDSDGVEDYISYLADGSGFLALDKNEDGVINDGSELFGTASGDGFKDLLIYDEDQNGWIDENDSVFKDLKVWCFDDDGNGELYSLSDVGVGAICLSRVATKFSLNDLQTNQNNGTIQETGIFLFENGKAGTVQHLDLAT